MNDVVLEGCTPAPLASYLKALGVLRLLSARSPRTRGYWRNNHFVLRTPLDREAVTQFFLEEYEPTPIISPWSGRAGFLEGDEEGGSQRKGAVTLQRVEQAKGTRFLPYQETITSIRNVPVITRLDKIRAERKQLDALKKAKKLDLAGLERLSFVKREEVDLKSALLMSLRGELGDSVLPWIDACFAQAMGERTPGPLLGSGGNEGSMDFSINHVGYLLELIDEGTDKPTALAQRLLASSLFSQTCPLDSSSNIGFLDTLATGGINMSTGFDGRSSGNIWDSVLAMEGTVLFASASTRRLESTASGRPSFPFAVSPSFAGDGSLAAKESAKPEFWLPIWNNPATIREIATLLAEGRITLGKRRASSGIDMLESLSSLGADRGIKAFERHGFYERRGQGTYVVSHLGRYDVPQVAAENWVMKSLGQHDWLTRFRRFAQDDNSARRFPTLRKRLEDTLFAFAGREPSKAETQSLLVLLGDIQSALSCSSKAREAVRPISRLSERWVQAADDGSPAFRIAKALAGLRGVGDEPLPLRAQLFPVQRRFDQWMTPDVGEKYRIHSGPQGRLIETLRALLQRRLWLAERLEMRDKPLNSPAGATLADLDAFLRDDGMDARIAPLLHGLVLCAIPADTDRSAGEGSVPAAFGLLKLSVTPDSVLHSLNLLAEGQRLPIPGGMLAQLAAGNHGNHAVMTAWRRLRSAGLGPLFDANALPLAACIQPQRACAALLIPLRYGASAALARSLLEPAASVTELA